MTNAPLTHSQGLLLDAPSQNPFQDPNNPATLLPDPEAPSPAHNCLEILAEIQMAREDLQDHPLGNGDLTWFADGSSFVRDGRRYAGAAVVHAEGKRV